MAQGDMTSMSYTFQNVPIYGIDGLSGKKIQIGRYDKTFSDYGALGGKLYYIDIRSDEVVEFLDNKSHVVTMDAVGQALFSTGDHELIDSLVAYKVLNRGTSGKDSCYVYYDEVYTDKTWTYKDSSDKWKYESLGTSKGIGKGKSNTDLVMAKSEYVDYPDSIWHQLKVARDSKIGGYDDWFVPSNEEVSALRSAIGYRVITTSDDPAILSASAVTGGVIAGAADGLPHYVDNTESASRTCYPSETKFLNTNIWSSYETPNTYKNAADLWYSNGDFIQMWHRMALKSFNGSVFFVRSF